MIVLKTDCTKFIWNMLKIQAYAAAAAKLLQSCLTLCDPIDGSPPGSPVPWILQARTLEWVAISFSNARKGKVKVKSLSRVWLLATPWTAAYQSQPSMGFSRQEYWSGVPLPSLQAYAMKIKSRETMDLRFLGKDWQKCIHIPSLRQFSYFIELWATNEGQNSEHIFCHWT